MSRDTSFISAYYPKKIFPRLYARLRIRLFGARFDELASLLPESGTVVDIGCGYGLFVLYAQQRKRNVTFVGIDTNARRISAASAATHMLSNVSFYAQDALTFPYPKGSMVMMTDMIHHVPLAQHKQLLSHIRSCIGESGSVCIADVGDRPKYKVRMSYWSDVLMYPRSVRCQFRTREQYDDLFAQSGFSVERVIRNESAGLFSTVIYVLRPARA